MYGAYHHITVAGKETPHMIMYTTSQVPCANRSTDLP